jgi:hypothetical protein
VLSGRSRKFEDRDFRSHVEPDSTQVAQPTIHVQRAVSGKLNLPGDVVVMANRQKRWFAERDCS